MAKHRKGILGEFTGKVGTVVGSNWKGVTYMRSLPRISKNRKLTDTQVLQRAKFSLASLYLSGFSPLIKKSYQPLPDQTGRNAALANLITQAIAGVYPNLFIDHSRFLVAQGSLKWADNAAAVSVDTGKLRFSWTDDSGLGNATPKDKAILVAYEEVSGTVLFTVEGGQRSAMQAELNVGYFSGKPVHTWPSFRSEDGRLAANSVYTGVVNIR